MAWENTLLASRILPPSFSAIDSANNRSQDASLILEQDGRLTLLVILTTAGGLAVVLLLFILLRIGCLRGKICFKRYKDRHDRSPCHQSANATATAAANDVQQQQQQEGDHCCAKSSQHTVQTITFVQDPTSNYTIKLIDNDLIIETQEELPAECVVEMGSSTTTTTANPRNNNNNNNNYNNQSGGDENEQSGLLLFKTWLLMMKNKEWDDVTLNGSLQQQPLETKSLSSSPSRRYGPAIASDREQLLANQRQQILARFGHDYQMPGFGFTRSHSSCLDGGGGGGGDYSYSHGNQIEYMGGQHGYVDPLYSCHQILSMDRPTTSGGGNARKAVQQRCSSPELLLPTFVRSAESLLVLSSSKEKRRRQVFGGASTDST